MGNFERRESGLFIPERGKILAAGVYHWQHLREGEVIDEWASPNTVVNQGLNYLLGVALQGVTPITTWYLGLFSSNYTPVSTDTAATFGGSATEVTTLTNTSRPVWTPAAPASQSITNSASQATFTFNAAGNVYGAFLASAAAFNATTGTLFSAACFSAVKAVAANDQLLMTYTLSAAST